MLDWKNCPQHSGTNKTAFNAARTLPAFGNTFTHGDNVNGGYPALPLRLRSQYGGLFSAAGNLTACSSPAVASANWSGPPEREGPRNTRCCCCYFLLEALLVLSYFVTQRYILGLCRCCRASLIPSLDRTHKALGGSRHRGVVFCCRFVCSRPSTFAWSLSQGIPRRISRGLINLPLARR
jgi:hypothetical protein